MVIPKSVPCVSWNPSLESQYRPACLRTLCTARQRQAVIKCFREQASEARLLSGKEVPEVYRFHPTDIATLQVNIESELEHNESLWLNALRDQDDEAVSEILHDEFTSTSARSSDVLDKREYLASIPQLHIRQCQLRDVSVHCIENVGIVKARLICDSTAGDREIHDDLLITRVDEVGKWARLRTEMFAPLAKALEKCPAVRL